VEGFPNLLTGPAKVGKTNFMLNFAAHMLTGKPFLGHATVKRPVILLLGEDDYATAQHSLLQICQSLRVEPGDLDGLYIRSVIDEPVAGGHRLATVDSDGGTSDTDFFRDTVATILRTHPRATIFIDPLLEFIGFDRYSDMSARGMVTQFLRSLCADGRTVIVTDHPSVTSTQSGRDVAGSVQMEASFPLVASINAGDWQGTAVRQQKVTFATKFNRYAPITSTTAWRVAGNRALLPDGAPGHTEEDDLVRVWRFVRDRLNEGLYCNHYDGASTADYPLQAMADELKMDKEYLRGLCHTLTGHKRKWLRHIDGAKGRPAHLALGPARPPAPEEPPKPDMPWE
jgi:hypothetical protein